MTSPQQPIVYKYEKDLPESVEKKSILDSNLKELFYVTNPQLRKSDPNNKSLIDDYVSSNQELSVWVFYPWRNIAIQTVNEIDFLKLRTARNKHLITEKEQLDYRAARVGVAGLSVGASIVASLVATGGPRQIKVADFDKFELTNLNRIRATILDLGENKAHIIANRVWETDPFADIELWDKGVSDKTIEKFILQPKLNVFIDEMDDISLKAIARMVCRKNRIPVVMATDNADGSIIDIERFDLEPERAIFHGSVPELETLDYRKIEMGKEWIRLFEKIVDNSLLPSRHIKSMEEIGKTLSGAPQLDTGASLSGATVALAVRKIATGAPLKSGKYDVSLEKFFQ